MTPIQFSSRSAGGRKPMPFDTTKKGAAPALGDLARLAANQGTLGGGGGKKGGHGDHGGNHGGGNHGGGGHGGGGHDDGNGHGGHGDGDDGAGHGDHMPAKTLYVWAGDVARTAPDFLAVVDFDECSSCYGTVLRTVPVPTANNEAHHMHLSHDGRTLVSGGLLSVLQGQDDIFVFDASDDRHPHFVRSTSAPLSSITDDFVPMEGGGFLVTQMGAKNGGTPGRVAEFDAAMNLIKEWPDAPPAGFNPHGISVRPEINLMVTADFVNPVTTLNAFDGPMEFRNTVRVWDLAARSIVRTITVDGAIGTMDVRLIPGDACARGYTAGMLDGNIYLLDTNAGTSKPVFDTATVCPDRAPNRSPQILQITADGKRMILPLGGQGLVVMLDITKPEAPRVLDVVDLGPDSGPHMMHLTHDGKRLIVTDYFLDEDDFGKVHLDGDRKVHVIKVGKNKLQLDHRFKLDFNTVVPTGPARPHGIAMK